MLEIIKQDDDDDDDQDDGEEDGDDQDEDEDHAVPEYKQLIAIHAWKPKGELQKWLADAVKVRRLSLSEQELENAAKTHGTDIVRYVIPIILLQYLCCIITHNSTIHVIKPKKKKVTL